jgi:hypothetical protein
MTAGQRIVITTATLLLIAALTSSLAVKGYGPYAAVMVGVWWGLLPLGLLFGIALAAAPARMIRWREGVMAQRGYQVRLGLWFSKLLAISGPRPWESPVAQSRVRALGAVEIVFWLGVGGLLLLWLIRL